MKYAPQVLLEAYSRAKWNGDVGELMLPEGDSMELTLHIPRDRHEDWMVEVCSNLHRIDQFVQKVADDYFIAGMDVFEDRLMIDYWGNRVNTQFEMEVYRDAKGWHCTTMGMMTYNPPAFIGGHE